MFEAQRSRFEELMGEARDEGQRGMLRHLAAKRFNAETVGQFAKHLNGIDDLERLAELGEFIFKCRSAEEVLARARSLDRNAQPAQCREETVVGVPRARFNELFDEALCEGERKILRHLVAKYFDAETAGQFAECLDVIDAPKDLAELGEFIVEHKTAKELLARAETRAKIRTEARAEVRVAVRTRGVVSGVRGMLIYLAIKYLDVETAKQFAKHLNAIGDLEHLAELGEFIVEHKTAEELLARARNMDRSA